VTCLSVDRCFGELYHCKTQCDDVVQSGHHYPLIEM
jgi:hypothetical protein